jgi:hypothetical protein
MNRLGRDFSNYLNTLENLDATDKSLILLIFGAISLITFSYMYLKNSESKENDINKGKNEENVDDVNDLE